MPLQQGQTLTTQQERRRGLVPTTTTTTTCLAANHPWTTLVVVATADDATFEDAFQDQVNVWDGPVLPIMLGIFGVVIAVLTAWSFLSSKVDDAIYQTIQDLLR